MSEYENILSIDNSIKAKLSSDDATLQQYERCLTELRLGLERAQSRHTKTQIEREIQNVGERIARLRDGSALAFYISDTFEIVESYKELIRRPRTISFFGKQKEDTDTSEKAALYNEFMNVARRHCALDTSTTRTHVPSQPNSVRCMQCSNTKFFETLEINSFVCLLCYTLNVIIRNVSASSDIGRINITSKYLYERKAYFYDTIIQYQAKQNVVIDQLVYDRLESALVYHDIASGDTSLSRAERFKNVTKDHIGTLLRDIDTNQYDNINLIHFNITSKKPDDIGHLEEKLLDDFDKIIEQYDKLKNINRKNFISSQYILFQLLRRHHHPCKKEDFVLLKRIERKILYDEIYSEISKALQWHFEPIV